MFNEDLADDSTVTSEQLKELQANLKDDLAAAIDAGNAIEIINLDSLIKNLSPRIFASESAEIRSSLDANTNRKAEIEKEISALEKLKKVRNGKLAKTILLYEKRQLSARQVEVSLFVADSELQNLRDNSRALRQKLQSKINMKKQETINNERFETI
jgi:hypothetical protein